ncbi:MAG TPA: MASE1 domain-containing protein [Burkholderiales bacterium]|nr:MASE1 domain-containing protein [Burkholderiales bacterium]
MQRLRDAGACVLAGAGYFALAWLSTRMTPRLGDFAYVWPAGGFALGVLLIAPNRLWLAFLAALFVADLGQAEGLTYSLQITAGYSTTYLGSLCLAAWILRRMIGMPVRLDRVRKVLLFVLVAPIGANAVAAGLGALVSGVFEGQNYLQSFRVWWVSDVLGLILVAPLVVAWADVGLEQFRGTSARRVAEAVACFSGVGVVAYWAFSPHAVPGGAVPPLTHFIVPFLIWAALRFGPRGQSASMLLLTAVAVSQTMRGYGPFSAAFTDVERSVLYLQIFLMVATIMTLLASALMRERQTALADAEEWKLRYETAVLSSGSVLYDIDLTTRRIVLGGNVEGMLGFAPAELSDVSAWLAQVHPADVGMLQNEIQALSKAATRTHMLEYRMRRKDGVYIDLEDSGRLMPPGDGQAVRVIGFWNDVTERRRAEADRTRLDAHLRETQKMEALGTMAGGIAHDFNNILGAILGYGEIALGEARSDTRQHRHLQAIMDAARRGKALVDQILTFARRGSNQKRAVELLRIVREVRDLLSGSMAPNVTLRLDLEDAQAAVEGNATQVHQLLMNLCTNAAQAMPEGGELVVGLATELVAQARTVSHGYLQAGRYAVLSVHDTGTGIAPEVLGRMFEPFYTTRGPGGGTGLGLALVQAIVADHGGAIDIETRVGAGTLFRVYLPAAPSGLAQADGSRSEAPRGSGETVLVVDDDRAMLEVAEEMLATLGYEPVGYDSGLTALEAFRARPERFDALLTDELMPGLSGTQLAQQLRHLRPNLPVVIASGYGGPDLQHNAHEAGVARVVPKPFESAHIARALSEALSAARAS